MPSLPRDGCPSMAVLDAAAQGEVVDSAVQAHLDECAHCQAVLANMRSNDDFLAQHRPALANQAAGPGMIPGCKLLGEIHRGGQGIVYKAIQTATRRTVAIKVLRAGMLAGREEQSRFEREARILGQLQHPNIVTVHDSGIAAGLHYLVLDHVDGQTLDRYIADGLPEIRATLALFAKICEAVHAAHLRGIIHRDLKPSNVMIDDAGEPHVLDFGLAKATVDTAGMTMMTLTGQFFGTPAWASPEQADGDMTRVDLRTDVYALGVLMYYLLTGAHPYDVSGTLHIVLENVRRAPPASPRLRRPQIDGEVETIVLKALQKERERRYQTAGELARDVRRYLAGDAIEAKRDSTWYVLRKVLHRNRLRVSVVAIALLVLPIFSIWMTVLYRRAHEAERAAMTNSAELSEELSRSNIERGRALAAAGDTVVAQAAVWPELIRAGVTRIDGPEAGFAGSPAALEAYWALWDIYRSSPRLTKLRTHGKRVSLLYFDEGGRRLCALDSDANFVAWTVATWERVRDTSLVAPIDGVFLDFAHSPRGDVAAFGGGLLRVIDPETGSVAAQVDDPDDQALTGAFSPDGKLLATIGRDNRLRLRNAQSLATVVTMEQDVCDFDAFSSCCPTFSLDGSLVAAARPGGAIGLWDTASGVLKRTLQPPDSLSRYTETLTGHRRSAGSTPGRTIAFAPDGTVATSLGLHLLVWPADGRTPVDLGTPGGFFRVVAFLPGSGGRTLISSGQATGGGGGITIIWDLGANRQGTTFKEWRVINTCAVSPDGRLIAMGELFDWVQLYEGAQEPHITVLQSGQGRGSVISLSPDGRILALTAPPDGKNGRDVVLMDPKSGTTINRFHREGTPIYGLEFAPDGLSLFEGERDGRTRQCDVQSGATLREFTAPDPTDPGASAHRREPIEGGRGLVGTPLRVSPDGSVLARARVDGLIDLWDVQTGNWIDWLDSGATKSVAIDFSPDSRTLAARDRENLVLWDVQTRQSKRTIAAAPTSAPFVRFSADGAIIACNMMHAYIVFLDTATGDVLSDNKAVGTSGSGRVFHPGGSVLFSSAWDPSIRLWDVRTGRELLSLQKHTALILSLLLTPDGNTLISSDNSGTVLAWDLAYYNEHIRRELPIRLEYPEGLE